MPPPQAGYMPPPQSGAYMAVPQPPKGGMSGCLKGGLIVGGILLFLGLGSCVVLAVAVDDAADDIEDNIASENERESADVSEPDCRTDDVGFMEAEVTVTNNSSERSNYNIEVTFEGDDGAQLETGFLFVSALEPGRPPPRP
jgi:hypothetical protein